MSKKPFTKLSLFYVSEILVLYVAFGGFLRESAFIEMAVYIDICLREKVSINISHELYKGFIIC